MYNVLCVVLTVVSSTIKERRALERQGRDGINHVILL